MSTNKTRIFVAEAAGTIGDYSAVTEFEVYQDAIDYAKSLVTSVREFSATANAVIVFLYSYDNTSYRFRFYNSEFEQHEIEYPDTETWVVN